MNVRVGMDLDGASKPLGEDEIVAVVKAKEQRRKKATVKMTWRAVNKKIG